MTLDDLDRRLIGLLREDARLPVSSLAHALGVSRGTVQNRIDRLRDSGEVLGFTLRLRSEAGSGVRAVCLVSEQTRDASAILAALKRIPEARGVHTTNGRWDIMVDLAADTLEDLDRAIGQIRALGGVTDTETLVLLTPHKG
ncbi:Lrp/AsnC family transcriptional regulator [Rhodospirillum rubrum]|uniref:Transcriptional regulator, AsnC family n=1 Tax=Rhodospirillum rubrum (strain ATCC 11170 / ATH 1.1.1 / DSM 467 / LMG 4362 / NCIMB 8255 / S1) TaxID=269796 RepID=Q2RNN3_RHORT|nr:Lrp/AsnC family transcriptional regulator [Rhodospirillum rubrum]ABC24262.1 transcriptional regulator, AsnC family [Rhodospirillum rubrum ATCC 11170]AEO50013.1 AsnC family transcriptional regulator [Rhodospirillum rubrum F11]MBK5955979.1 Lrp/AsnC family transcriptional regulator [Rhodospirillum rubrum]QXG80192.1 Lrp/AsnC family transcriptional regulator [Rhodospirillum rubrum]